MSRKPSFQVEPSMSYRFNHSDKQYPMSTAYKKSYKDFDKFSSQVQDRNASQQTHYTTINYSTSNDFLGIRKLPDSISSIRETFSFNPVSTSRRNQFQPGQRQIKQRLAKINDGLRQSYDIRSNKKQDQKPMERSISTYLSPHQTMYIRSDSFLDGGNYSKRHSIREDNKNQVRSFTHLGTQYKNQKLLSVEEEIQKFRQQINKPIPKRVDSLYESQKYNIKSSSNLHQQPKKQQNFAKKNYIEYYTPKVQKTHQNQNFIQQNNNVLSPQYIRPKKQTSFDMPSHSPRKISDIKTIKETIENKSAPKKKLYEKKVSIDDFIVGKSLGQGRFGTAHMAIDKATGAIFALKKVKKQVIKQNKLIDQFILQVKLQSFFVHPFILKIYGIFDDKQYIYIILQFMEQGTLFNYLKKVKKLEEQDTAQKIRYLAESIKYLQDRGIAHRDIKPENIIMSNHVCKLADFGWATFCDEQRRKTYCGTCDYVAPQILQGHQYDETVDLWCIGVLAYQLMAGKAPFYHMSQKQTKKKILNASLAYPQTFSENVKSFISGLILKDPEQRMSIEEVLVHPFIKHVRLIQ